MMYKIRAQVTLAIGMNIGAEVRVVVMSLFSSLGSGYMIIHVSDCEKGPRT
jgi:hypothetical protein